MVMTVTEQVIDKQGGGEDWKRRSLAPGFVITPENRVMHIEEWRRQRLQRLQRLADLANGDG
jgi:hypothetical protein